MNRCRPTWRTTTFDPHRHPPVDRHALILRGRRQVSSDLRAGSDDHVARAEIAEHHAVRPGTPPSPDGDQQEDHGIQPVLLRLTTLGIPATAAPFGNVEHPSGRASA